MERKQMEVDPVIVEGEVFVEKSEDRIKIYRPKTPAPPLKQRRDTERYKASNLLEMNRENVLRGIIFSEIFGSPLARRKR